MKKPKAKPRGKVVVLKIQGLEFEMSPWSAISLSGQLYGSAAVARRAAKKALQNDDGSFIQEVAKRLMEKRHE